MRRSGAILRGWVWAVLGCVLLCVGARAQMGPTVLLPSAIAYDAAGNLYFADTNLNQVLEATLSGQLIVVAGNGVQGFAGDGGLATSAELNAPQGVAVGPGGTIYIADTGNQRVRAVSAGTITTFTGNGTRGFAGDGGMALAAEFSLPTAVAVDASGALLVCDSNNHRVRRIAGGVITTVAGNGVQGFAGDSGPAVSAQLNTPMGVATAADGSFYIADTRNQRIRFVSTAGAISTFAGTGVAGFSGDGAAASAAQLALPRGLVLMPSGALLIADENNQRVRIVNSAGVISTLQGSGVQGVSTVASDGVGALVSMLNSPRAVGISIFAQPAVADSGNKLLRVEAANVNLYAPAGLAPARSSMATLNISATAVYGQLNATVIVAGPVGVPQGSVRWLDGSTQTAAGTLMSGSTAAILATVGVGVHAISATYGGDGLNPAVTSTASSVTVTPAALLASANAATMQYGTTPPVLTGVLTGVLAQDSGNVTAQFTSTATDLSPVGTYPITVTLAGRASGNYTVMLNTASGNLVVTQAASTVSAQINGQNYVGFPVVMRAAVAPAGMGSPSGTVTFLDGTSVVASTSVVSGVATGAYASPSAGTHAITASYSGDGNFLPSTSTPVSTTVSALPDFTVSVTNPTQTVQGGLIAVYNITVSGQGAFSGAVSLGVSGLPAGATANFSPPQLVPGNGLATAILNVQTTTAMAAVQTNHKEWFALLLVFPLLLLRRRKQLLPAAAIGAILIALAGCSTRTVSNATLQSQSQSYTFTVTGTGTNLAGAVVVRSSVVMLTVQ